MPVKLDKEQQLVFVKIPPSMELLVIKLVLQEKKLKSKLTWQDVSALEPMLELASKIIPALLALMDIIQKIHAIKHAQPPKKEMLLEINVLIVAPMRNKKLVILLIVNVKLLSNLLPVVLEIAQLATIPKIPVTRNVLPVPLLMVQKPLVILVMLLKDISQLKEPLLVDVQLLIPILKTKLLIVLVKTLNIVMKPLPLNKNATKLVQHLTNIKLLVV
jgi:hypothetical protein